MAYCNIVILTTTDGKTDEFRADGCAVRDSLGVTVGYKQDGDDVTLRLERKLFRMEREGSVCLAAEFRQSDRTSMTMRHGIHTGIIPVYTEEYRMTANESGYEAVLDYQLDFSNGLQKFHLKFNIEILEEK